MSFVIQLNMVHLSWSCLNPLKQIQCGDTLLTYVHIQISLNRMEIFLYLQFPMPRPLAWSCHIWPNKRLTRWQTTQWDFDRKDMSFLNDFMSLFYLPNYIECQYPAICFLYHVTISCKRPITNDHLPKEPIANYI